MLNCKKCLKAIDFVNVQSYICSSCNFLNEPDVNLNSFEIFGLNLSFNIDLNRLEDIFLHLVTVLHPDNHAEEDKEKAELHSSILNNAYNDLKNLDIRAKVLFKSLFNEDIISEDALSKSKSNEYFLTTFEKLDNVSNMQEYKNIKSEVDKMLNDVVFNLNTSFKAKNKKRIKDYYSYLKYTNRLLNVADIKERELNDIS